jgi:predicted O-methyltransferase YrrM
MLRGSCPEYRAFTDLFVPPYCNWVPWNSGLATAHHVLYGLARAVRPQVIVEIGSARGKSTCALALACAQNACGKVYSIDPHDSNAWAEGEGTFEFLRARVRDYGLEPWCHIVRSTSRTVAQDWFGSIDFLFIDGDHTYEGVRTDFELFQPWLSENAIVLFHDSRWEYQKDDPYYRSDIGVPLFLEELKLDGYHSVTLPIPQGLTILYPKVGGFSYLLPAVPAQG